VIIDAHTHILPPHVARHRDQYLKRDSTFRELYGNPKARMINAEDLIANMDQDGVEKSIVLGIGSSDPILGREINDYIIESVNLYPNRLIGFADINPSWGATALQEIERCAEAGLQGIGELHPDTQGFDIGDLNTMAPMMDLVKDKNFIVTTHSSEPVGHFYQGKGKINPERLWRFIYNFPDATIVCAHWGGGLPFYALMPEVARAMDNVYFDTAASPLLYSSDIFNIGISLLGKGKILLGSDYPLVRPRVLIAEIEKSKISHDSYSAITFDNASTMLTNQI